MQHVLTLYTNGSKQEMWIQIYIRARRSGPTERVSNWIHMAVKVLNT